MLEKIKKLEEEEASKSSSSSSSSSSDSDEDSDWGFKKKGKDKPEKAKAKARPSKVVKNPPQPPAPEAAQSEIPETVRGEESLATGSAASTPRNEKAQNDQKLEKALLDKAQVALSQMTAITPHAVWFQAAKTVDTKVAKGVNLMTRLESRTGEKAKAMASELNQAVDRVDKLQNLVQNIQQAQSTDWETLLKDNKANLKQLITGCAGEELQAVLTDIAKKLVEARQQHICDVCVCVI